MPRSKSNKKQQDKNLPLTDALKKTTKHLLLEVSKQETPHKSTLNTLIYFEKLIENSQLSYSLINEHQQLSSTISSYATKLASFAKLKVLTKLSVFKLHKINHASAATSLATPEDVATSCKIT